MVGLRALAEARLLQLDEVSDVGARADMRLRPQVAERPEDRFVLHDAVRQDAIRPELNALAQRRTRQMRSGAHHAVAADDARALDDDVWVDDGVGADRHRVLDVARCRIEHGDAALHQPVENARALHGGRDGELLPVVDAERLPLILHGHAFDARAAPVEDADDVGEVVLTLIVVRLHLGQCRPQTLGLEAVHRRVDLRDLLLVVGGVAVLDHALHAPALPEDAAVPLRAVDDRGEDRRDGARRTVMRDEAIERFGRDQRHVGRQDEDRPIAALGFRLKDGVPGAEAFSLLDHTDIRRQRFAQRRRLRWRYDDEPIGERVGGTERIRDEGAATERVEHFRLAGAHTLAFARSEDHDSQAVHDAAHSSIRPARSVPALPFFGVTAFGGRTAASLWLIHRGSGPGVLPRQHNKCSMCAGTEAVKSCTS